MGSSCWLFHLRYPNVLQGEATKLNLQKASPLNLTVVPKVTQKYVTLQFQHTFLWLAVKICRIVELDQFDLTQF